MRAYHGELQGAAPQAARPLEDEWRSPRPCCSSGEPARHHLRRQHPGRREQGDQPLRPAEHVAVIKCVTPDTGGPGLDMAVDLARLGFGFPVRWWVCRSATTSTAGSCSTYMQRARHRHGGYRHPARVPTAYADVIIDAAAAVARFFHYQVPTAARPRSSSTSRPPPPGSSVLLRPGVCHARWSGRRPGRRVRRRPRARPSRGHAHRPWSWSAFEAARIRGSRCPCLPHLDTIIITRLGAAAVTTTRIPLPAAHELLRLSVHSSPVIHLRAGCVPPRPTDDSRRLRLLRVPLRHRGQKQQGSGGAFTSGVMLGLHKGMPVSAPSSRAVRGRGQPALLEPSWRCSAARRFLAYGARMGSKAA